MAKIDPVLQAAHYAKIAKETKMRCDAIKKHADKDGNVTFRIGYKGHGKISKGEGPNAHYEQDDTITVSVSKADTFQERAYGEVVRAKAKKTD